MSIVDHYWGSYAYIVIYEQSGEEHRMEFVNDTEANEYFINHHGKRLF